jgi:tetratricopeptide (TPR) repeat protein
MRRYDSMRPLYAEVNALQGDVGRMLQQLTRNDKPFKPGKDPRDAIIEMSLVGLQPQRAGNPFWDKQTRDEMLEVASAMQGRFKYTELMTKALLEDLARSAMQPTVEGDVGLWRAEMDFNATKMHVYLGADRGTPKVIGDGEAPQGAGRHVLRLLAKNDEKSALRLLDWLAKDLAVHKSWSAKPFTAVWGDKLPRARKDMELAAAILIGTTDPARTTPILTACSPSTTMGQFACDWTLSEIYKKQGRWGELLDHARAWKVRATSMSAFALVAEAYALAHLNMFDDADKLLADALAKDPDERVLVFTYADMAAGRGQLGEAAHRLEALTSASSARHSELNDAAWLKLIDGSDVKGAELLARRAVQVADKEPHVANTAAAIEAELGELNEAKQHLDISVSSNAKPTPGDPDLYVHARILEQLGYVDDAIAVYRRLKPDGKGYTFSPDAWVLAERRLKALGVKK